jgi:CHAT domain-containing protein/Tfp pilus assembly protein PilF
MEIISNSGVKMAMYKKNRENLGYFLLKFTRYGLIGLLSVVLVSESVGARATLAQLQIAQETVTNPSVPLSGEKQQRYQEADKLVEEGKELGKKGTKEASQQAIEKYQQALKILEEIGLRVEQASIYQTIGVVYFTLSEYPEALKYFEQYLNISRELKLPILEGAALFHIAQVYSRTGKPREALTLLKQAESIFRTEKIFDAVAGALMTTASIYTGLGEIPQTIEPLNQALQIYRDTLKNLPQQAIVLNQIGFSYSQMGEPKTALKYYEQALEIQQTRQDLLPAQANTLKNIGSVHYQLGKHNEALDYLNKARNIQQAQGLFVDEGLTVQTIGDIYVSQGDYQKALEFHKQARILFQRGGNKSLESMGLGRIISIYKNYLGDNDNALKFSNEALKLDKNSGDKERYAANLNQQADIKASQGDYQKALEICNQTLEIARSAKNKNLEADTFRKMAFIYELLGDYDLSAKTYKQALQIYRQIPDKPFELMLLPLIGNLYMTKEDYPQAINYYNQTLSLSREQNNDRFQGLGLMGLARIYELQKDFSNALKNAETLLALSQNLGNKYSEIGAMNLIGIIHKSKGDYKQSLNFHRKALLQSKAMGLLKTEAQTLNNISITHSLDKQYQLAIDILSREIKLRRELKDIQGEADAFYLIAINQRKLDKLETALTNIDSAIKIVENIRSNVKNPDLRTSYFATVQGYYKFKIDLLMELHKKQPSKGYDALALNTSEASRARGLVDLLTEAGANIRKGANPQLLAEEQRLQQLLNGKEKARIDILSTPKGNDVAKTTADKLGDEIADIISQQQQLKTQILTKSPEYAALKYPQPLELKGIQQQLDKDTILLQYSLGKERSYLWLVTPDSVQAYELAKGEVIEEAVENFREAILTVPTPYGKAHPDNINQPASQLSQMILAPVANKLGKKRLVIVADGALQNIPFAALADPDLTPQPPSLQGKGEESKPLSASERGLERGSYQPLLVNHEIVNLPSVTALATQRKYLNNRELAPKTLAVLADPLFPPQKDPEVDLNRSIQQRAMKNLKRSSLDPLPGTRIEAEAMLKLVPSEQTTHAFGADANYNFATNPTLKQYRHLFFATHGFVDTKQPELSGIALAQVDKDGKPVEKGYLRLGDIFNMDWAAELVVLSACETGLGKDTKGEGLVGLTRGLMYAGSKRAVVSLWKVSDQGTSELMPIFYKSVLAAKSPAVALREAQLQMLQGKDWKSPYYWAAFTLQGEWR